MLPFRNTLGNTYQDLQELLKQQQNQSVTQSMSWRLGQAPAGASEEAAAAPATGEGAEDPKSDERAAKTHKTERGPKGGKGNLAKRGGGAGQGADLREAVVSTQKLVLRVAQESREYQNALYDFWLVPSEAPLITAGTDAGQQYNTEVKKRGKGHGLGPPHCHIAIATVEAAIKVFDVTEDKSQQASQSYLQEWVDSVNGIHGLRLIDATFSLFKVKAAYQREDNMQEMTKVMFGIKSYADYKTALRMSGAEKELVDKARRFAPDVLREALNHALFLSKGSMPMGAGPKTELERVVERQLKQLVQQGVLRKR